MSNIKIIYLYINLIILGATNLKPYKKNWWCELQLHSRTSSGSTCNLTDCFGLRVSWQLWQWILQNCRTKNECIFSKWPHRKSVFSVVFSNRLVTQHFFSQKNEFLIFTFLDPPNMSAILMNISKNGHFLNPVHMQVKSWRDGTFRHSLLQA